MDDTISRQAAIDAIHEDADWLAAQGSDWQVERMERDKSILKSLPTVQPKHGKWIERNPLNSDKCRLIECDQCGNSYIVGFNVPYEHWTDNRNYCEKCGADMRGEAE